MMKFAKLLFVILLIAVFVGGGSDPVMATRIGVRYKAIDELDTLSEAADTDTVVVHDASAVQEKKFPVSLFISGHASGSTTMESTASHITAAQLAFGLIIRDNPSDQIFEIADGSRGKMVTIQMTNFTSAFMDIGEDTTGSVTSIGWSKIRFDDANDSVTLLWLDDTSGWMISSNDGCVITK